MKTLKINHAAVWILVLIHQIIGAVWYSPFMFAGKWTELIGKSASDFENAGMMPFVISIAASIITNYVIAYLFVKLGVENFIKGLYYAFIFWLGFLFVETATFYSFELKPIGLALINSGKSLVTFLISGFILGMWNKYDINSTDEHKL